MQSFLTLLNYGILSMALKVFFLSNYAAIAIQSSYTALYPNHLCKPNKSDQDPQQAIANRDLTHNFIFDRQRPVQPQQNYINLMSLNTKIRKRVAFTPIMLTSKSIRPVDRSDYQLMRNQRKLSKLRKTRDDFTNFVFRESQHFERMDSPKNRNQEQSECDQLPLERRSQDESYSKLIRKTTTPAVVKVEFQRQTSKSKYRMEQKVREMRDWEHNDQGKQGRRDFKRLLNLTNARTFQQFTKISKMQPSKRLAQRNAEDVEVQWKKYLDKYYLNIRKVRPILKKQVFDLFSVQKVIQNTEIHQNSEQKARESPQKKLIRFKSNSPLRSTSKCQSRLQNQQKILNQSTQRITEDLISTVVLKKIEHDILNRKSMHKKQFFVFGLNEASNKSNQAQVKTKFEIYKDFLFRVNYTNEIYVGSRDENQRTLKFYVGFGNNSAIIKGIMRRRFWWQITDKIAEDTNFIWNQLKVSDFFKGQNCNRFKPKQKAKEKYVFFEDSTKSDAESGSRALMKGQDLKLWQRYYQRNIRYQQKGFENALLRRAGTLLKNKKIKFVQSPMKIKVQNHFQSNYFLGNKKALFYSLRKYYQLQGIDPFTRIPLTFHINQGLADPQFERFLDQFQAQGNKRKVDKQFRNIWIVKPGELTNRGRGITVCSTLDQIKIRLKAKQRNSNGTARTFIIQKYIQRPLLYQRRKFDIRHYMAITCVNGEMKGYWYAEGYIRTTSSEYNIKNTKDLFTHLTNDAVQKNGQDYGKFEKGNKVSYAEFQKYLTHSLGLDVDFNGQILTKMRQLATDSIKATYSLLDPQRKQHNFELFGLDYMLDQELNVYLIQVNTNPCLETSCPLLTKIITPLVQNLFKLCLDPIFPPPMQWPTQRKYYLGQNAFQENKFSLVFDEVEEGFKVQQLYKNAEKVDARMGDIFQEDQQYCDEQKEWNDDQETKK